MLTTVFAISTCNVNIGASEFDGRYDALNNQIYELNQISTDLGSGIITEEEYAEKLLHIYHLSDNINISRKTNSAYYKEVQCGYINYKGVKYLYKKGLCQAQSASEAISLMLSAIPGCGWGISAVSIACKYGGYSSFEKAVHQAYSKKKGIKVYYKIHKSVMSMNKVRYVVG